MLGGPRAFERPTLSPADLWSLLRHPDPELESLLKRAVVPEILADGLKVRRGGIAPISLVTLPQLTDRPDQLLSELKEHALLARTAAPGEHFGHLFNWLRTRFQRRVWVERSGGSLEYAELLRANWPGAKFVHLVRDGRDTALSMASHPMFKVRVTRLVTGRPDLSVEECLRANLPCHHFASYWSALMLKGQRFFRSLAPKQARVVHYEQLMASPRSELAELARFVVNRDPPEHWLDHASAMLAPKASRWTALPIEEREALEARCRPGLRSMER